jgi:hypothetical protein
MNVSEVQVGRRVSVEQFAAFEALGMFLNHERLYFVENVANVSYAVSLLLLVTGSSKH